MKTFRFNLLLGLIGVLYVNVSAQTSSIAPYRSNSTAYNGSLRYAVSHGRTVRQDSTGHVYTVFDVGLKSQEVMMGTPFWNYPTWQTGSILLNETLTEKPCTVAYNVTANEVLFKFNADTTTYTLQPVAFTIGDDRFVRLQGYPTYFQVLYQGDAQLFSSYKRRTTLLKPQPYGDDSLIGYFMGLERYYYLKLPNGLLHSLALTRKSLMQAMGDNVDTALLPKEDSLTVNDVIRVLSDYDAH